MRCVVPASRRIHATNTLMDLHLRPIWPRGASTSSSALPVLSLAPARPIVGSIKPVGKGEGLGVPRARCGVRYMIGCSGSPEQADQGPKVQQLRPGALFGTLVGTGRSL